MFCTTECWDCEDKTCEHYVSKTKLYFENENNKKEIERLNNIINNTAVELEILLQSKDFELITMQLRNIVFRLKGSDKK